MIRLNIHEVKTHLSKYLAKLEEGETILLCQRNKPIAEIRPVSAKRKKPLSHELLAYFNGEKP
jgi:antitoxin (DNA-binding transcriptional repressor) of toxin-antitoxin stability system